MYKSFKDNFPLRSDEEILQTIGRAAAVHTRLNSKLTTEPGIKPADYVKNPHSYDSQMAASRNSQEPKNEALGAPNPNPSPAKTYQDFKDWARREADPLKKQ